MFFSSSYLLISAEGIQLSSVFLNTFSKVFDLSIKTVLPQQTINVLLLFVQIRSIIQYQSSIVQANPETNKVNKVDTINRINLLGIQIRYFTTVSFCVYFLEVFDSFFKFEC